MTAIDKDPKEALGNAAKIIDLYGCTYWPIFVALVQQAFLLRVQSGSVSSAVPRHR